MITDLIAHNKIAIGIGILALGILTALLRPSPQSSPRTPLQSAKMNEHIQQNVQFFTEVKGAKDSVKVYFAFSFKDKSFPLTLGYQDGNTKDMNTFLVFHPEISLLTWPTIRSNGITFMQKTAKFASIEDFLQKPEGRVLIDRYIFTKYRGIKGTLIDSLDNLKASDYDYILTSHAPLKVANNTYYYENSIDASDASIDEYNQITWLIRAPDADDQHVFYLSNIDVEFLSK